MRKELKQDKINKKKKKSRIFIILFLILIIAIAVYSIFFISKVFLKQIEINKELKGSWTTDGYTVYEFYGFGKGALVIPMETYNFNYKIEDNKVFIDFENERSIDSDYEFSFEDDKLILKGINSTTGTYTFTKKEK